MTGEPNATVYVYRREGGGQRLDAFLGRVDADGSGTAVLPVDLAPGTLVAATQETTDGTSELRLGLVPPAPGDGGGTTPPPGDNPTPPPGDGRRATPAGATPERRHAGHHDGAARGRREAQPRPRPRRDPPGRLRGIKRRGRVVVNGVEAIEAGVLDLRRAGGHDDDSPRDGPLHGRGDRAPDAARREEGAPARRALPPPALRSTLTFVTAAGGLQSGARRTVTVRR